VASAAATFSAREHDRAASADKPDRAPSSSKSGPARREEPVVPVRPEPIVVPTLLSSSEPVVIPETRPYPWAAVVMALIAGLAAGGVGGYGLGTRKGRAESTTAAVRPAPGDTEVTLPSKTASDVPPAVVAPPKAADATSDTSAKSPVATPGQILVHTVPNNATVSINGRGVGPAPQTIKDLPLGTYTIRVARAGYVTQSEQVSLTKGTPWRDVTLRLPAGQTPPDNEPGSVSVDSRPRGARVFLDGRNVGVTPVTVSSVTAGAHVVKIEMSGYKPLVTKATVKAGDRAQLAVSLERKAGYDPKPR